MTLCHTHEPSPCPLWGGRGRQEGTGTPSLPLLAQLPCFLGVICSRSCMTALHIGTFPVLSFTLGAVWSPPLGQKPLE